MRIHLRQLLKLTRRNIQLWDPQPKKHRAVKSRSRGVQKIIMGLEHLSHGERLKELRLLSLERRLQGDLTEAFQFLKGSFKKHQDSTKSCIDKRKAGLN